MGRHDRHTLLPHPEEVEKQEEEEEEEAQSKADAAGDAEAPAQEWNNAAVPQAGGVKPSMLESGTNSWSFRSRVLSSYMLFLGNLVWFAEPAPAGGDWAAEPTGATGGWS